MSNSPPTKRVVGDNAARPACHDHISCALIITNFVVVIILACMYAGDKEVYAHLPNFLKQGTSTLGDEIQLAITAAGYTFLGCVGLSLVYLVVLYFSAFVVIILGQLCLFVSCIVFGIVCLQVAQRPEQEAVKVWWQVTAVIAFLLSALLVLWLVCIRHRIAFTAAILSSVAKVLVALPELIFIQLCASLLVLGFGALWLLAYFEMNARASGLDLGWIVLLNILAVLCFFWGQLTLLNISTVTTNGAVGSWYFSPTTVERGCVGCRPAVCAALFRACTTSLGSIAFGSLLVAIIRTIIVVVKFCADRANASGNPYLRCAFCCCVCLLSCLERVTKWLTDYAFVYVAVYGTPFITSGIEVMELLASSGMGALAQQSLVSPVLYLACLLGLGIGCALGYAAEQATAVVPAYHLGIIIGGVFGYLITGIVLAPVDAGCKTIFVCYAEEPQGLNQRLPELAEKLRGGAAASESTPLAGDKKQPLVAP